MAEPTEPKGVDTLKAPEPRAPAEATRPFEIFDHFARQTKAYNGAQASFASGVQGGLTTIRNQIEMATSSSLDSPPLSSTLRGLGLKPGESNKQEPSKGTSQVKAALETLADGVRRYTASIGEGASTLDRRFPQDRGEIERLIAQISASPDLKTAEEVAVQAIEVFGKLATSVEQKCEADRLARNGLRTVTSDNNLRSSDIKNSHPQGGQSASLPDKYRTLSREFWNTVEDNADRAGHTQSTFLESIPAVKNSFGDAVMTIANNKFPRTPTTSQ